MNKMLSNIQQYGNEIKLCISTVILTATLFGCKKDNPIPSNTSTAVSYSNGVFVSCEGPFGSGTGTVSFYNRSSGIVTNDIFQTANGFPLGNIVQSVAIYNGKGYIAVNNAAKVEVVDATDFKSRGTITGLTNPRYFLGISSSKGYLTEWGSSTSSIKVINLATNLVSTSINTANGAESMVKLNNKVYVTCNGGYGKDSVVMVINTLTDAVIDTIVVGPNPDDIQVDANGNLWVLCSGQWNSSFTALDQTGKLVRIDTTTNTANLSLSFSSTSSQPANLTMNTAKDKMYFTYQGSVYTHAISSSTLNSTAYIGRSFYGLGLDPVTDYLFATDPGNYVSNGKVIRYNTTATKIDSFTVGIIPGGLTFK